MYLKRYRSKLGFVCLRLGSNHVKNEDCTNLSSHSIFNDTNLPFHLPSSCLSSRYFKVIEARLIDEDSDEKLLKTDDPLDLSDFSDESEEDALARAIAEEQETDA